MFRRAIGCCLAIGVANVFNIKTHCSSNDVKVLYRRIDDLHKKQRKYDCQLQRLKRDFEKYKNAIYIKDLSREFMNDDFLRKFIDEYKQMFKTNKKLPEPQIKLIDSIEKHILFSNVIFRLQHLHDSPHTYFIKNPTQSGIIVIHDEKTKKLLDEIYEMEKLQHHDQQN